MAGYLLQWFLGSTKGVLLEEIRITVLGGKPLINPPSQVTPRYSCVLDGVPLKK